VNELLSDIEIVAREQHGIVSWDELLAAGATMSWIERREREGYLTKAGPAAYRVWGAPRTVESRAVAAVRSVRAPAVVSHLSAAWLHGLEDVPIPGFIDITVPRHRRPRRRAGVTVHETRQPDLLSPVVRKLIPVTGVARTILDCCRVFPDPIRLLDDALRQRLVTWDNLWHCYLSHQVRGLKGLSTYRAILLERDGNTPPAGEFARRMARVFTKAGLPQPVFEHPVTVAGHKYYLDVAWPRPKITVECNGAGSHDTPKAFRRDPVKRNRVELAGWLYLEFTWWDLVRDPAGVVAQVEAAFASREAV
jgi:hypothetical protein